MKKAVVYLRLFSSMLFFWLYIPHIVVYLLNVGCGSMCVGGVKY